MEGGPFQITTGDPNFDPNEPVRVNGYLFVPAGNPVTAKRPHNRIMVERKSRKKVLQHG